LKKRFEDVEKQMPGGVCHYILGGLAMRGFTTVVGAILCVSALPLFAGLAESDKKSYQKLTYKEVVSQRKELEISAKKRKVSFQILFGAVEEGVSILFSNSKTISQRCWTIRLAGGDKLLPLIFNTRDQKLKADLLGLAPDTLIRVYGKLGSLKKKQKQYYYLEVLGFDAAKAKVDEEVSQAFSKKEYSEVVPRRLDIRFTDYIDKKVKFRGRFRGIRNSVPREMVVAGVKSDKYFMLQIDGILTPVVVSRDNMDCVEAIVAAKNGDDMVVYATMRKVDNASGKVSQSFYYLSAALVVNDTPQTLE